MSDTPQVRFHDVTERLFSEVSKKLDRVDQLVDAHQRTREDMVEVKAATRAVADTLTRIETRQDGFEKEINHRLEENHRKANETMARWAKETHDRVESVENEVKSIREERIAEKAQWRGPEKIVAALAALASAVGLFAAVKGLIPGT